MVVSSSLKIDINKTNEGVKMTVFKLNKMSALCGCLALASAGVHAAAYDLQTAATAKLINSTSGIAYKGRISVPKKDLAASKDVFSISFKSEDKSLDGTVTIPQVADKAWNDTAVGNAANPANVLCSATVTTNCIATTDAAPYEDGRAVGWTHNSNWYLVDLTALDNGKYDVSIKLENNNDGTSAINTKTAAAAPTMVYSADLSKETSALKVDKDGAPATTGAGFYLSKAGALPVTETDPATDDDFTPGFTVWNGYQSSGSFAAGHWYPSRHQTTVSPFWGNMLKPEMNLMSKDLPKTMGYDTASDNANKNAAEVAGTLNLTSAVTSTSSTKGNRYLTIALGGDHRLAGKKELKNYKLTVTVTKK